MENTDSIKKQGLRYILTGVWNTVFGILVYTILIKLFGENHYLLLVIPSNILAITNAYICYKIFVFKTQGNILKEYVKCYTVYGTSFLVGLGLMYVLVDFAGQNAIVSNIVITFLLTIVSFLGHKYFSFAKKC